MPGVLFVEVGDRFYSMDCCTQLDVIKIWFEYSQVDNRWETSVMWETKTGSADTYHISGKACVFVQRLNDDKYHRVTERSSDSFSLGVPETDQVSVPWTVTDPAAAVIPGVASAADKQMQWEQDFRQRASSYGLSPADLGRIVALSSHKPGLFTIIGANPKNWKMPILVKGKRGGIYKITAERARRGLDEVSLYRGS